MVDTIISRPVCPAPQINKSVFLGFLLIFPITRKLIFGKISSKFKNKNTKKNDFIEGEFEDIEDDNER